MAELARRLDVTGQFLGDVIAGRKNAGKKLLGKLGAKTMIAYEITVDVEASTNGSNTGA